MPKNKNEESSDATNETQATDQVVDELDASAENTDAAENKSADSGNENIKEAESKNNEPSIVESVFETVTSAVKVVAETVAEGVSTVVSAVTGTDETVDETEKHSKRAEKIGVVASDKMTKTVVVRVDRVVKHPMYRKYIKRRKKFMAHDEMGAAIGDKVRIVETRPLSARKRWRVVEIIQKAVR